MYELIVIIYGIGLITGSVGTIIVLKYSKVIKNGR